MESPFLHRFSSPKQRQARTLAPKFETGEHPSALLTLAGGRAEIITGYGEHYSSRRLHSALGYIALADKLPGRQEEIFAARDRKLKAARQQRRIKRQAARERIVAAYEKSSLTKPTPFARVRPSRETEAGSAEEQSAEG
jgi:hypothetical protein